MKSNSRPFRTVCRAVFYVFKAFFNHINDHTNILNTKCIKCGERTTKNSLNRHLVHCHGFGLFQCVYCRFGTNTFEIINNHIANEHPSKLPLFCERSEFKTSDLGGEMNGTPLASSIDSTCLKHINNHVSPPFLQKAPPNEVALRNVANIGNLGFNIKIRGFTDEPPKPKINVVKMDDLMKPQAKGGNNLIVVSDAKRQAAKPVVRKPPKIVYQHRIPEKEWAPATTGVTVKKMSLGKRQASPVQQPRSFNREEPKPSNLQIQSVFSLSNSFEN